MQLVYRVTVWQVTRNSASDLHREPLEVREFTSEWEATDWALDQSFNNPGGGWRDSRIDRLPISRWKPARAA